MRTLVGQLDVAGAAMSARRARAALIVLAALSMAHVGSPDTFFTGKAGPYDVRISVRLPGVIPGRAQVAVRVAGAKTATDFRVAVRAGQWNVGLKGAPPPEAAPAVPGDPELHAAELWFMTPTSYQLHVSVDGPSGNGTVVVPVMALATAQRTMAPGLGTVLAALGIFLTVGLLTIIGAAVRESVLPPGVEPDTVRAQRARFGVVGAAVLAALVLWGGSRWWSAEAAAYGRSILYRPFDATATISAADAGRSVLTLGIRDPRWTGTPVALSRYNALLPDHGKLMHMFLVREPALDAFAHLHPIARTPQALDFDGNLPALPSGRYRVYGDIVHESGYAQTLVATVDVSSTPAAGAPTDPDDSSFTGSGIVEAASPAYVFPDRSRIVWKRGEGAVTAGTERVLAFALQDENGAALDVEPYMGMAAHVAVASQDGAVFAHLHPSGSISMAAFQKFTQAAVDDPHAGHAMPMAGEVEIPYAFPRAGGYRLWVQMKRNGAVNTAAFDVDVR
jgi:hypothetical protein